MKRRPPPEPRAGAMPARLARFRFADWLAGLPEQPTDEFVELHACTAGTKGTLAEDWNLWRALKARQAWGRARADWESKR